MTLPEEKKNTMENMTIEQKADEYIKQYLPYVNTTGHWLGFQDGYKQALSESSGSVAAPKEESLIDLLQSHRLSYTFEEDGETGLSLLDRLTPPGDNDVSRGNDEIQLLAEEIELHYSKELASLRQQLTDMKEVVKDLLPLAQEVFDSITIDDGESHKEYVALKSLLSRAKALLDKH